MSGSFKPPGSTPVPAAPPARSQATVVYQLRRSLAELPEGLRLRNREWGILFAVTGEHSCAQIGQALGLTADERDRIFSRLATLGLIEERPLSYGEYLRALSSWNDEEPRPLAAFLRGGQAMPGVVAAGPVPPVAQERPRPPVPPVVTADSDLNITRALPTYNRQQLLETAAQEALSPAFLPLDTPVAPPKTTPGSRRGALSIKALMQLILGKASDVQTGQLDIYRVFIRINTKLLQKNGITTLRFQEDRLIDDPELQQAITSNVQKVLGFPCPPEVFV